MPTPPQQSPPTPTAIAPDAASAPGLKNRGLNDASAGPKFSLRTLLIVTAIGAVVAAAAGMAYRAAPTGSRAMLLLFWLTLAATFAVYLAFQWRSHMRRLTLVGPIRFTLERPDLQNDSTTAQIIAAVALLSFASLLIFSIMMAITVTLAWARSPSSPGAIPTIYSGAIIGAVMTAAIHFLYRPRAHARPTLLGDHGVIVRRRVLRWESFKQASWHYLLPNRLMLYGSGQKYAAAVPDSLKEEVEAFVATKMQFEVDQTKLAPGR